jgi:hypothetical protein
VTDGAWENTRRAADLRGYLLGAIMMQAAQN